MINRKFLHFNTDAAFNDNKSLIPYDSIVFIKESRRIYTHGAFYACEPSNKLDSGIRWSNTSYNFIHGVSDVDAIPQLINPHELLVTYEVLGDNVIDIDNTGFINVLNNSGQATIIANFVGNDRYESTMAVCTITVKKQTPNIRWSSLSATVTLGASNNEFPTIVNSSGVLATWTFDSSDKTVATISPDVTIDPSEQQITLVGAGSTVISAHIEETDIYDAYDITYTLYVNAAPKQDPNIYWIKNGLTANNITVLVTFGQSPYDLPSLENPNNLLVHYSSSNTSVATIADDGIISIQGIGDTTIQARTDANETYNSSTVSYIINVDEETFTVYYGYLTDLTDYSGNYSQKTVTSIAGTYTINVLSVDGGRLYFSIPTEKEMPSVKMDTGLGQMPMIFQRTASDPSHPGYEIYQDMGGIVEPDTYTLILS